MNLKIFLLFVCVHGALDKVSRKNEASDGLEQLGWHLVRSAPANENMVSLVLYSMLKKGRKMCNF